MISKHLTQPGKSKDVMGIDDGAAVKELLFSFPRLMTSEHDKLAKERLSQVGEIRVFTKRATFLKTEQRQGSSMAKFDASNFQQANKKDAKFAPTNSTTRIGAICLPFRDVFITFRDFCGFFMTFS